MTCPCNTECTDCVPGFQKIIDLKNVGLVIYRRTTEKKDVNKQTGNVEYAVNTTEDVYVLHNTKDTDISSADYWPEIERNTINCPRCRKLIEHAQNLLRKGPTLGGNDVTGICNHCKIKDKPCLECRHVVKKFVPSKSDQTEINKERVKHWITKIGYLLSNITDEKKRVHSDTHIDQICHNRQRSIHKPDVEQLFEPLELDLAISKPNIDIRINGQNKEKKPFAHFAQLEKLKTSVLFNDDEILGERSNLNVRRILKPKRKILTSNYIATPVRINSSEFVGKEESVVSFEQIFKDAISGTDNQQGATDEIIGFKPTESKLSPLVNSKKVEEKSTRQRRARSVQPLEKKKENLLNTKTEESECTELMRKYHSAETLVIKIHGITEHNLKQANRIVFPEGKINKPTKQKSSSELIKDTKDNLIRAEEEKNIKNEQTSNQSDKKETAMKKADYQETAVDYNQNARQAEKHSVKSNEKDSIKAEEEVYKIRKDFQKSLKDTGKIDTQKSEKEPQKAFEKGGYKSEKGSQKASKGAENAVTDGYTPEKDVQKATKHAQKSERDRYKSEGGAQKATKAEKEDYSFEKSSKKTPKNAPQATKDGYTSQKGTKKSTEDAKKFEKGAQQTPKDAQKAEEDGYKSKKEAQKAPKETQKAVKAGYKYEKGIQKAPEDVQKADKHGNKSEKGAKKFTKDAQVAEIDAYKSEKGDQKTPKDFSKSERDGYTFEKANKKSTRHEKNAYKFEKGAQQTPKDAQKAERGDTTPEKGGKELTKDSQIAVKKAHKFEKSAQKMPTDAQKDKNDAEKIAHKSIKDSQKEKIHAQKTEIRGHKTTKDFLKSLDNAENDMTSKSPNRALKEDQITDINIKKITMIADDLDFEKQIGLKLKEKTQVPGKKTKVKLPSSEITKIKDQELKLKVEKEKVDDTQKKLEVEIKSNAKLGKEPISDDLLDMKSVKLKRCSIFADDLILKLVQIKQSTCDSNRLRNIPMEQIKDMRLPAEESKVPKHHILIYPPQSETCLLWTDDSEIDEIKESKITDVIIGPQICKIRPLKLLDDSEAMTPLLKSDYDSSRIDKKNEISQTPDTSKTKQSITPPVNEIQKTSVSTEKPRTKEATQPRSLRSPGNIVAGTASKGYVRYTLSDRKFIDNGWTLLPTEKVVRKMNVYRMRPARPEFDWFEHNKNKRLLQYDTGEKLAELDDNGRGRWFYRNGRMALDYYDSEELNAGQRFVIYSNGEPDERGRSRPYTLLATFDFLGNGIVFDHRGKIRLKYNQTEGVVLDRSIGPVSHWKWHTLNDPPVLQQVMIDTQIAHKDPKIMKMGGSTDNKPRKDNEEMLAIEFDNFIKEKSKKLSQAFKPFQIKMKALKINEHFSLRVLDQATVYLLYRDGTTNLKLNIGMVLDQKEIVDTDTAEVGEVSSSMEKFPARTESLAGLQRSVAHAQHYDWKRTERERKMHPVEPNACVDKLFAGIARPLRPPPGPMLSQSTSLTATEHCKCSRKPTSTSVYYDTRFY